MVLQLDEKEKTNDDHNVVDVADVNTSAQAPTAEKKLNADQQEIHSSCNTEAVHSNAKLSQNDVSPPVVRKMLDDRYIILKTIGHGRYAK